jgi:hypothetical protein
MHVLYPFIFNSLYDIFPIAQQNVQPKPTEARKRARGRHPTGVPAARRGRHPVPVPSSRQRDALYAADAEPIERSHRAPGTAWAADPPRKPDGSIDKKAIGRMMAGTDGAGG